MVNLRLGIAATALVALAGSLVRLAQQHRRLQAEVEAARVQVAQQERTLTAVAASLAALVAQGQRQSDKLAAQATRGAADPAGPHDETVPPNPSAREEQPLRRGGRSGDRAWEATTRRALSAAGIMALLSVLALATAIASFPAHVVIYEHSDRSYVTLLVWALATSVAYSWVWFWLGSRRFGPSRNHSGLARGCAAGLVAGPFAGLAYALAAALVLWIYWAGYSALSNSPWSDVLPSEQVVESFGERVFYFVADIVRWLVCGIAVGVVLDLGAADGDDRVRGGTPRLSTAWLIMVVIASVLVEILIDLSGYFVYRNDEIWPLVQLVDYLPFFVASPLGLYLGRSIGGLIRDPAEQFSRAVLPRLRLSATLLGVWVIGCALIVLWSASAYYTVRCEPVQLLSAAESQEGPPGRRHAVHCPPSSIAYEKLADAARTETATPALPGPQPDSSVTAPVEDVPPEEQFGTYLFQAFLTLVTLQDGGLDPRSTSARSVLAIELVLALFWTIVILAMLLEPQPRSPGPQA